MTRYRVVHVTQTKTLGEKGWAVEESVSGGRSKIVTGLYQSAPDAHAEAERLIAKAAAAKPGK
jgi:hypothetical protein